jgi:hypothetical protein
MKTRIILITLIINFSFPLMAQPDVKTTYPLVVSFQSMCCGVPSDSAITNFIRLFKKQYKVKKIKAYHIGPMGREGEYYLAFKLNELNKRQVNYFISRIKNVKPLTTDKGSFSFTENQEIDPSLMPKRTTTNVVIF